MANQPGWTRERLRTADDRDVAAARWVEFVKGLRPLVTRDIDGELATLAREDMKGAARDRELKSQRGKARESLAQLAKQQRALRKLLLLDESDDG